MIATVPMAAATGVVLLRQRIEPAPNARLLDGTPSARVRVEAGAELYSARYDVDKELFCTFKSYKNQNLMGVEPACFEDTDKTGTFSSMRRSAPSLDRKILMGVGSPEPITPVRYERVVQSQDLSYIVVVVLQSVGRLGTGATIKTSFVGKRDIPASSTTHISLKSLPVMANVAGAKFEFTADNSGNLLIQTIAPFSSSGVIFDFQ